jgi:uncharacterized phage infection (PIP) family protein YhgE
LLFSTSEIIFLPKTIHRQEVGLVPSTHEASNNTQDLNFLRNLKDDLHVLQTSWQNKSLHPNRVIRHFTEILDSVAEIARADSFEPADVVCADAKEYLESVAAGKASLDEQSWSTISELIDLLSDSLRNGPAPDDNGVATQPGAPLEDSDSNPGKTETTDLEEGNMSGKENISPEELLKKAQEALLSGDGETAKEMALKAAELIAERASEERKEKERQLTADLETITREHSEAEKSVAATNEKIANGEETLNALTERLSEAQSALDERDSACKKAKEGIDKVEAEMAEIKERHKALLDEFQEALPARDAAERECAKIKSEYGELPAGIETLRDSLQDLEHQMEQIGKRKAEKEADLEKFAETVAA